MSRNFVHKAKTSFSIQLILLYISVRQPYKLSKVSQTPTCACLTNILLFKPDTFLLLTNLKYAASDGSNRERVERPLWATLSLQKAPHPLLKRIFNEQFCYAFLS